MDDREIIRRIQAGEKRYLNDIAGKYYDDIYYFCCYQTGSRTDAYDLAQETFLRFIRYVEQYRYKNLKGYLLTIAMNVCRNYFFRIGQEKTVNLEIQEIDLTVQMVQEQEQSRILEEALQKLPDTQREAVLLHHFYGYKNREIAQMTGVSYGAVKSRVNQGLSKLQQLLNKEDFYG